MKILGAILLLCGSLSAGMISVLKLRRRAAYISDVIVSLTAIKSEISESVRPVRDVFEDLAMNGPRKVKNIFSEACSGMNEIGEKSLCDIWKSAVDKASGGILRYEEAETLKEIGHALGKYDIEWQTEAINIAIKRFEAYEKDAKAARDRDSKAHVFLGLTAGVFSVLLLI